jgi:hypothetical protein
MSKIKVYEGQSIYDIAVQEYGSVEGLFYLLADNNLTLDSNLKSGAELVVRDSIIKAAALVIKKNNQVVNNMAYLHQEDTDTITIIILQINPEDEGKDGSILIDVEGGSSPYKFLWTNNEGATVSTSQNLTAAAAGTYNVTVTDSKGRTETIQNLTITLIDNNTYLTDSDGNVLIDQDHNQISV